MVQSEKTTKVVNNVGIMLEVNKAISVASCTRVYKITVYKKQHLQQLNTACITKFSYWNFKMKFKIIASFIKVHYL